MPLNRITSLNILNPAYRRRGGRHPSTSEVGTIGMVWEVEIVEGG